jgi:hypothetical protein
MAFLGVFIAVPLAHAAAVIVAAETFHSSVTLVTGPGFDPPPANAAVLVEFEEKPIFFRAVPIVAGEVAHDVPSKVSVAFVELPG